MVKALQVRAATTAFQGVEDVLSCRQPRCASMTKKLAGRIVTVKCETPHARRYTRRVSAHARALLKILSLDNCELSLVLTDDVAIRELNHTYRRKDRPTDVLSFPQMEDYFVGSAAQRACSLEPMLAVLGDVVISIDTAIRQAESLGVTIESRLRALLIHGVLHLVGYDHEESPAEARRMFARERELAAALASIEKDFARWSPVAAFETAE
jgi:probable rRNA maturation factor